MKKLFTLAAAGTMAVGSLTAQAQVTVDGVLSAAEISTANYQLVGKFTTPRGFGDYGLLSLYAASSPTKFYFFVAGTVENNGNALQLYMDLPGVTGATTGVSLPAGAAGTSFEKMTAKLDLPADMALALRSDGTGFQVEGAVYTSATAATSRKLTTTAAPVSGTGTALTLPTPTGTGYSKLAGARVAYRTTTSGKVLTNPGYNASTATPAYGAAGSFGWEIELDRANFTLATGTPTLSIFVVQNNPTGGFLSSDYIPQSTGALPASGGFPSPNLGGPDNNSGAGNTGGAVDFAIVPGRQATTITLGASGILGNKAAEAAVAMAVYPNPAIDAVTIAYNVANKSDAVNVVLTDLMGRQVRVLENSVKSTGTQLTTVSTAAVAAGTYLVQVQVGENISTRKVVLL
ncbi:T9SS type A sorting domain-containing protein [Hymenobacter terrenus]|uniref:T9SS type A sorting domain-containing protein n=1 Tax=Hymenobacter terrenus TaxID=1629124 RepID=UPI000619723E|nr:T9SS type A sorting domain-containing protein [Hymenobacter terrenus]